MLSMIIIGFIAALVSPLLVGLLPMILDTKKLSYFDSEFLTSDEETMFPADWNFTIAAHEAFTYEGHSVSLCLCKACALDKPKKTTKRTPTIILAPMMAVRPTPYNNIISLMPKSQVKPSFIRFNNSFDLSDVRMAA